MNVLLIEDEPKIAAFIVKGLDETGYDVTAAYDGKSGLSIACQGDFDIIILDIMLPEMNGLEICKKIRQAGVETPILMLTALGTLDDKVDGLQHGADDYMVKPFHFKELVARIQALTRRKNQYIFENSVVAVADLTLDRNKKTAMRNGAEIVLTAREYALLELLMTNANRVLSRNVISERVWGYDFDPGSNIVDVYVSYLRNKIDRGHSRKLIHTLVGMGYTLKE